MSTGSVAAGTERADEVGIQVESPSAGAPSLRSWSAMHAVDIAFALVIGILFVRLLQETRDTYFFGDDWPLLLQAGSFGGMLEPYNGHLSVTILALYRVLVEVFGLAYGPFQAVGLLCLMAIPVTYFVTTRRLLGPPVAAIAALSMLGFAEMELHPAWLNHYLVLIGAIGCAAALNRGRRADLVVAGALGFSLCAAGGGVAVAVACVAHSACTRAPIRRWLAVLAPCIAWGAWWIVAARGKSSQVRAAGDPSLSESLRFVRDVLWSPFDHLGLGSPVLAALLAAAFVGYGAWSLRQGLATAASFLAWSGAMVTWAVGLALARGSRGFLGEPIGLTFRYQLLALGFALLAVVPRRPIRWPARFPLATSPRWLVAASLLIVALAWAGAAAVGGDVEQRAARTEAFSRITKGDMVVLDLGPEVLPDDARTNGRFFWLDAGEVRVVLARHDNPFKRSSDTADQELADLDAARARVAGQRELRCEPLTEPLTWLTTTGGRLFLWSDQPRWAVEVRRFGSDWVELLEPVADQVVAVRLPSFGTDAPWEVRADGACRTEPLE